MATVHPHTVEPPDAVAYGSAVAARVSIRGARAAFIGPALNLAPHRNAVAVVALALRDPFELACWEGNAAERAYRACTSALIPPGRVHHLRAHGPMAFVYLDALSDDHAALPHVDLDEGHEAVRDAVERPWTVDDLCRALGLPHKPPPDPRIAALLHEIDARPGAFERASVAARFVGVSTSHCRELLRRTAGVPFRRYRLWRRVAIVIREAARGVSLTEAALAAGFASSAHLSVTFKTMFGLAPSALLKLGPSIDLAWSEHAHGLGPHSHMNGRRT